MSAAQISDLLKRVRRRSIAGRTTAIRAAMRGPQLFRLAPVTAAAAAVLRALSAVITTGGQQITMLDGAGGGACSRAPDAEIIVS